MTFDSGVYWENRYASGGNSGVGSVGASGAAKARYINAFVADNQIRSVVEFGCGDGHQLAFANYPDYVGLDVSETALLKCRTLFALDNRKRFYRLPTVWPVAAELALSLDVIYHLVEDSVYRKHLYDVFGSATHHVILYTSDSDHVDPSLVSAEHVLHRPVCRNITSWFGDWLLADYTLGSDGSDFYRYKRR